MLIYNVLLVALLVVGAPAWIVVLLLSPRLRPDFLERLRPLAPSDVPGTWVHAASVGEVEAVAPLVERLLARGERVVATTLTLTGRARMRDRFPEVDVRLAPLDLPGLGERSLARARIRRLVIVETEIWPNLLRAVERAGVHAVIVSARLSDSSFPTYLRFRWLFGPAVARLGAIGARSPLDAERFIALGARPSTVEVMGDLKLAGAPADPPSGSLALAVGEGPFFLAGSTHPGEEEAVYGAWCALREREPRLRLLLAPRHPERAPAIARWLAERGEKPGLRSSGAPDAPVVIVDTLGELASLYGVAELVFCGGTLVPVGGHNLLEPARAGRVVLVGPHTQNQRAQIELLEPLGVIVRVPNAASLPDRAVELFAAPDRHAPGRAAAAMLGDTTGALDTAERLVDREGCGEPSGLDPVGCVR